MSGSKICLVIVVGGVQSGGGCSGSKKSKMSHFSHAFKFWPKCRTFTLSDERAFRALHDSPRLQRSGSTRRHLSDPELFSRGKLLESPSFEMSSDNPASFCPSEAIARFRSVLASVILLILSSTPETGHDFNIAFVPPPTHSLTGPQRGR